MTHVAFDQGRPHKVRCIDCGLCDGRSNRSKSRGVVDRVHGVGADNLVTARAQSFRKQAALPVIQEQAESSPG